MKSNYFVPLKLYKPKPPQMNTESHSQDLLACSRNYYSHKLGETLKQQFGEFLEAECGVSRELRNSWEPQSNGAPMVLWV